MTYVGSDWVEIDRWEDSTGYGNRVQWRIQAYSSQDVASNTSRINFRLQKSISDGSAWASDSKSFTIVGYGANGDRHSASQTWVYGSVSDTSWVNVGGDTSDMYWSGVAHRSDGTLSLTANATGDRVWGGTFDTDISIELPRIPRASSPSVSPNPQTWTSTNTNRITVNTNRKSSGFTHKIRCDVWGFQQTKTGVGASTTFDIPYSALASMPDNLTSFSGSIHTQTYSGSTAIGSEVRTYWTIKLDTSIEHPNIGTITVEDTNSRTSAIVGEETFIYGISTLQATIPLTVSGSYTQLASATVTCGNKSQTYTLSGTSQTITFTFDKVNASSLSVTVKDKRGTSVSKTKSYTLMAYQPVTATGTVGRVTATGSTAVGQVSGVAYGGDYGQASNELTITYKYKEHDATTWTDSTYSATLSLNEGQQTYTHAITLLEEYDYQKQYDIQFVVNDLFNTATYTAQLMQGLPILSWDETEVDVFGDLHIHNRDNPYVWQDVMAGFDAVFANYGQKNLLPLDCSTTTSNGITYTVNSDGSIKVNGTASTTSFFNLSDAFELESGREYIMSGTHVANDGIQIHLRYASQAETIARASEEDVTFTAPSSAIYPYIIVSSGTTLDNVTVYPMIRDARIASEEFVPFAPNTEWNYKSFSNSSAGVTSGSVRWMVIGRVCFANFYDVVLTNVSHATNAILCSGLPPARTAMLFLISAFGTGYSAMRMRVDTDGNVYFHYAGTSLATQHYGQVFYIIK